MSLKPKAWIAVVAGFILIVVSEWLSPKEPNWFPSFSKDDKIPLGTYILYDLLEDIYPGEDIWLAEYPAYNAIEIDSFEQATAFYCDIKFDPDKLDRERLMEFTEMGNTVFISAQQINRKLLDTLKVDISFYYLLSDTIRYNIEGSMIDSGFTVKGQLVPVYFSEFDSSTVTVLGENSKGKATFLRIPFGEGAFYLHSLPHIFTNYNLLKKPNEKYVNALFSLLPLNDIIWDEYYKGGRRLIRTPLRYILNQKPLKYAWYITIITVIIFIIFQGKRKQRIIPLIQPPKNDTVDFATTIGRLYYQNADHKNIALKMINYFFEYIRSHFYINPASVEDDLYKKISAKSGRSLKEVEELFNKIVLIQQVKNIDENQLMELNNSIEKFVTQSSRLSPGKV